MNDYPKWHHPTSSNPEMLSKLCRRNSCLEIKQDPQGIPIVSFNFCGWNPGEWLIRKKIKRRLTQVMNLLKGHWSSWLVIYQLLRDCNNERELNIPHGSSISFNPYNSLGQWCGYYSHIRLTHVQCYTQGHRASKAKYWILLSYWFVFLK